MKKIIVLAVLIFMLLATAPIFADLSIDLGATALGTVVYTDGVRPLGGMVGLGVTMFDYKAMVQLTGNFFTPPIGDNYEDSVGSLSAGVLFSPVEYLYIGMRSGMITPPDAYDEWLNYSTIVMRVQRSGKGMHFFAETELNFQGTFSKLAIGLNLTL